MKKNKLYKKEFGEALISVNSVSENLKNLLSAMISKNLNAKEWKAYLDSLQNFNNSNERFKKAVLEYYGFESNQTESE